MSDHEQVDESSEFTAGALISRGLTDYEMPERLSWLRGYAGAGFLPTSRDEANSAFRVIYYAAKRNQTAKEELDRVRTSTHLRMTQGDPVTQAENTVRAVARDKAAFARQASRDGRKLKIVQAELLEDVTRPADYPNAASYLSRLPTHEGGGQLARFLDAQEVVNSGREPDEFAINAKLVSGRQRDVVDPYTIREPERGMSQHIARVLEAVSMNDLPDRLAAAVDNEDRRLAFWTGQLVEMQQDQTAQLIARTAIEDLNQ